MYLPGSSQFKLMNYYRFLIIHISRLILRTVKWFQEWKIIQDNSSIQLLNRTLTGTTSLVQCGRGSNGKERVLHIPQSFKIGDSPSNFISKKLVLRGSYPSAEIHSVHFIARADRRVISLYFSSSALYVRT